MCSPVPNSKKWFRKYNIDCFGVTHAPLYVKYDQRNMFSKPDNVPVRLSVGIMLLMASFTSYLLRVNMSINILGMVHPKHHHNHTNATFLHDVNKY